MKKRYLVATVFLALILVLLLPGSVAEAAGVAVFKIGDRNFQIDGQNVRMDVAPYIQDGRTMLPISYVAPALGTEEAIWYPFDRTVYIKKGSDVVVIKIGSKTLYRNDREMYMDTAAEIKTVSAGGGGRTMLPIAWVARALEVAYDWDAYSKSVYFYGETHSFDERGTYGPATGRQVLQGSVVLETSDIILQNTHIQGNLIVADSVGQGNVTLNNVTVTGPTYIRGGGKDSVYMNGGSYNKVYIQTRRGLVRLVSKGIIGLDVIIEGTPQGGEVYLEGEYDEVDIMDARINLLTLPSTNIQHLSVAPGGVNNVLNLATHTLVRKMTVKGLNFDVRGAGIIQEAIIFADGATFAYEPLKLTVGAGATKPSTGIGKQDGKFFLAGVTPGDDSQGVGINATLKLTFSKNAIPVAGKTLRIYRGDGSLFRSIPVNGMEVSIKNNQATVIPGRRFEAESEYYILIDSGAFKDRDGNLYDGITSPTTWNFSTGKTPELTAVAYTPLSGSANIAVDRTLEIEFSEIPQAVAGKNIYIFTSDGRLADTISATNSARVSINGRKVLIKPTNNLAYATTYYVHIDSGAFKNNLDTIYTGIVDDTTWTFSTIASPYAPRVLTFSPPNKAENVAVNAVFEMNFNKEITAVAGKRIIIYKKDGTEVERIDAGNTNQVSVGGTKAAFRTILPLDLSTSFYVKIDAGAFKDRENNNFGGIQDEQTWTFSTATDAGAPMVVAFNPGPRAASVSRATNFSLTFNKPVTAVRNRYITIIKKSDHSDFERIEVSDTSRVRINPQTNEVTINPAYLNGKVLEKSTEYYMLIDMGAFRDSENRNFAGILEDNIWTFTTTSSDAPVITTFSPQSGAADVAKVANLVFEFNESVNRVAGKKISVYGSNGMLFEEVAVDNNRVTVSEQRVTVNLANNFETGRSYYVLIDRGAFKGKGSNQDFEGISNTTRWVFTATDALAPQVLSLLPANGAKNVAPGSILQIVFSEQVLAGSNAAIIISSGSGVWETIQADDITKVAISGNVVEISPAKVLDPDKIYQILISDGSFTDISGNKINGLNAITWTFTTGQGSTEKFTETVLFPANGATDVPLGTELRISFSRNIGGKGPAGFIVITNADENRVHVAISTKDASVDIGENTNRATISGIPRLASNTNYYITISEGAFLDLNNERYEGIVDTTKWRFKTEVEDLTPPRLIRRDDGGLVEFTAEHPTSGRKHLQGEIVLEFDEAVKVGLAGNTIDIAEYDSTIKHETTFTVEGVNRDQVRIRYSGLRPNRRYYLDINTGAINDDYGNPYNLKEDPGNTGSNAKWIHFWTIVDENPPVLASVTPASNSNDTWLGGNILLEFEEEDGEIKINPGGAIVLFEAELDGDINSAEVHRTIMTSNESRVKVIAKMALQVNVAPLNPDKRYFVIVTEGAVEDLSGNRFKGLPFTGATAESLKDVNILTNGYYTFTTD